MDRKTLIRQYKEKPLQAGVFQVRNTVSGRSLVGSSPNLPGMLNRQRFQLASGSHPDKELQKDWNDLGPEVFAFEILDILEPPDEPSRNPTEDLRVLKEIWLDKLSESGVALYPQSRWGT
ncbi:MAG: GIY-YIG nuclease family protein [Deltaproteobacteria bacterium]|nr:GIY-YIG nuclease family protein [Deltaproteobacteria bacterium]